MSQRESWLNGWLRQGDTVLIGTAQHCAACGKTLGVVGISISPDSSMPAEDPGWPFDVDSCPLCFMRNRDHSQQDKLTERLRRLQRQA